MIVLRGIVSTSKDPKHEGMLSVKLINHSLGDNSSEETKVAIPVKYTSPFFNRNEHGMIAIPAIGSEVLISWEQTTNSYYYLTTIVSHPISLGITNYNLSNTLVPKEIYRDGRDVPMVVTFKDQKGGGLSVWNSYDPDVIVAKTEIKSVTEHKVILSDTPSMDGVYIRNRSGDGTTFTDQSNDVHGAQSIDTKSKGSNRTVVREGEHTVTVTDGRDMIFWNNSTGANKDACQPRRYGNVNLVSSNKDVNIYTEGDNGDIFITTHGGDGIVQIKAAGDIDIYSKKKLNIHTTGDINIKSDANINMEAININLKASQNIQLKAASQIKVGADAAINIGDGVPLNLNKPGGSGSNPAAAVIPPEKLHPYEEQPMTYAEFERLVDNI